MTRETKVGLAVAGSFVCLVGIVVYARMHQGDGTPKIVAQVSPGVKEPEAGKKAPDDKKGKPAEPPPPGPPPVPGVLPLGHVDAVTPTNPAPAPDPTFPAVPGVSSPGALDLSPNASAPLIGPGSALADVGPPAVQPPPPPSGSAAEKAEDDKVKQDLKAAKTGASVPGGPPPLVPPPGGLDFPLPVVTPPENPNTKGQAPAPAPPPQVDLVNKDQGPGPPLVLDPKGAPDLTGFNSKPPVKEPNKEAAPTVLAPSPAPPMVTLDPKPFTPKSNPPPSPAPPLNVGTNNTAPPPSLGAPGSSVTAPSISVGSQVSTGPGNVKSYDVKMYVCKPEDTSFEIVSARVYGTDKLGAALRQYNREYPLASPSIRQDPPRLSPGVAIYYPPREILESRFGPVTTAQVTSPGAAPVSLSTPAPIGVTPPPLGAAANPPAKGAATPPNWATADKTKRYRVRGQGEMIIEIARNTLNDSRRWTEIYRLNPSVRPEYPIPGGTEIYLPMDANVP